MASQKNQRVESIVVNTKTIAKIFGVSERRIRQMVEEDIIERVGHGRFNLLETISKYISYLKIHNDMDGANNKTRESLDYEKFLHERAKRELAEIELAQLKGQMHHSAEVEKVMTKMLADFRTRLLALPAKVAPRLIARDEISLIQDMIQIEIYEALSELSEYDPSMFGVVPEEEDEDEEGDQDE